MSTDAPTKWMTTEEFLALPDDGVERWLINGEVREFGGGEMTVRNWIHSAVMMSLGGSLKVWRDSQPAPRGVLIGGEAGIRLSRHPDVTVGVDVGYMSAAVMASQRGDTTLLDGVPELIVEILSPSDTVERIHEKLATYRQAGVPLVWVIDPYVRTATIYQPGLPPRLVTEHDDLEGGSVLPGFRVPFRELFE